MKVSIYELPLFKALEKSDHWEGYLPQMIGAEFEWAIRQSKKVKLPPNMVPYFETVRNLWHSAMVVAGNGDQNFAVYGLRAILERVALLWTLNPDVGLDPNTCIKQLEGNNRKVRVSAVSKMLDSAKEMDVELESLYDILSRYYGHISHLDRVPISLGSPKNRLLALRARTIPLFLLFDVGHRVTNLIWGLLELQRIEPSRIVCGRNKKINPEKFMRIAAYIMCERHSQNRGVNLGILYNEVKDIVGQVGITNIYRGGMDLYRYGSADDLKPSHEALADFSIFVIGPVEKEAIKVKRLRSAPKGEAYRVSWPKAFEIDGSALALRASVEADAPPFFDYVSEFVKLLLKESTPNSPNKGKSQRAKHTHG